MAGAAGGLIQAALAAKLSRVRLATAAYLRDRTEQGRSTLNAYLVAIGFYAVAGIFMIAALLVGAAALFFWLADTYGLPIAFAATIAGLIVLTAFSALIAASAMRPPRRNIPSLGSRLRVAVHATAPNAAQRPRARDHAAAARDTAASVLREPPSPHRADRSQRTPALQRAGLAAAVGLIGWALARRYSAPAAPSAPRATKLRGRRQPAPTQNLA